MFRRATAGARQLMPNVDGWDALLWLGVAIGFFGLANKADLYTACIVLAIVVVTLGFLGSSRTARPSDI